MGSSLSTDYAAFPGHWRGMVGPDALPEASPFFGTRPCLMRLAICVASAYEQNSNLPKLPSAELDLEIISQRLAQSDAGFTVHAFTALRGLAEGIEHLIE